MLHMTKEEISCFDDNYIILEPQISDSDSFMILYSTLVQSIRIVILWFSMDFDISHWQLHFELQVCAYPWTSVCACSTNILKGTVVIHIDGVMVSLLVFCTVDLTLSRGRFKSKTIKLTFAISLLTTQYLGVKTKTGWRDMSTRTLLFV